MTPRDEAADLMKRPDELVSGPEFRRILKNLLDDSLQAYEAGFAAGQMEAMAEIDKEREVQRFGGST